jgi:hypothetical protein
MAASPSPRQRLDEWGRILPGIWRAVEAERSAYRQDSAIWPSYVFLPLERAGAATMAAIAAKGDPVPRGPAELSPAACTTQCLAAWRMTQGIYRIDPTLYEALIETPVTGDIPADVLLHLPEWCTYVETPGMAVPTRSGTKISVVGLWYWLDETPGHRTILCIGIDTGRRPPLIVQHVPLVGTIEAAISATLGEWEEAVRRGHAAHAPPPEYREAARAWLPAPISLALYLCGRAADISGSGDRPANPRPVSTRRGGMRIFPADGPRRWDVGVRLGAARLPRRPPQERGVHCARTYGARTGIPICSVRRRRQIPDSAGESFAGSRRSRSASRIMMIWCRLCALCAQQERLHHDTGCRPSLSR